MSKELQPNKTPTQLVNNELTERVNNAYIGSICKLMRGDKENWVMMECTKDDKTVDVLFDLDDMEEMVAGLKKELK
jgi:hypothetical protein